ncbi:EboA domain-containing protein [Robertkochia flava]|uniref:EboA domain-containing protein n=1 Tax=Robertkochia flava TaxID=3447986 RepID=UPI001CCD1A93|nr:EboA domain-containing protein [Robertkochia marina]
MITSRDSLVQHGMANVLEKILHSALEPSQFRWLEQRMGELLKSPSARELYLAYTLIGQKFGVTPVDLQDSEDELSTDYLAHHEINLAEAGRLWLLLNVLQNQPEAYEKAVQKLIEVADGRELTTFLRDLWLLPALEHFCDTAVEALRTNMVPVFDAIALHNPYPTLYFNEQQWNQMYLKAAFMQRPLQQIVGVEERANVELSRIISDYAHERWAASREIDARIWRPVAFAPAPGTLEDIRKLLKQGSQAEIHAAVLVAASSADKQLRALALERPDILERIKNKTLNWNNLK